MGKIYTSATVVLSHLGRQADDSDIALDFMNSIDLAHNKSKAPDSSVVRALFRLCLETIGFWPGPVKK